MYLEEPRLENRRSQLLSNLESHQLYSGIVEMSASLGHFQSYLRLMNEFLHPLGFERHDVPIFTAELHCNQANRLSRSSVFVGVTLLF